MARALDVEDQNGKPNKKTIKKSKKISWVSRIIKKIKTWLGI
jgi:hypothetical protein